MAYPHFGVMGALHVEDLWSIFATADPLGLRSRLAYCLHMRDLLICHILRLFRYSFPNVYPCMSCLCLELHCISVSWQALFDLHSSYDEEIVRDRGCQRGVGERERTSLLRLF